MLEVFKAAVDWANLPLTALLGLVMFYWVFVIVGFIGLDTFDIDLDGDADLDLDVDADVALEADADVDLDVNAGADIDGDVPAHSGGVSGLHGFLAFLNLDSVPLMIVVSVMALAMWTTQMTANHFLGWGRSLLGFALYLPVGLVGVLVTKIVTTPFAKVFRSMRAGERDHIRVVGRIGDVVSDAGPERLGQLKIFTEGAPLLLNVRTRGGEAKRGQKAFILEKAADGDFYYVEAQD